MVTGTLRAVLWILGSLAVAWLVLGLAVLPSMAGMMGEGGMMRGGMMEDGIMGGGMACCGGGMMGMMALQTIAMLGLVGVFVYLVADALRSRRAHR